MRPSELLAPLPAPIIAARLPVQGYSFDRRHSRPRIDARAEMPGKRFDGPGRRPPRSLLELLLSLVLAIHDGRSWPCGGHTSAEPERQQLPKGPLEGRR